MVLCTNLKRLKKVLNQWNKECFGNVFDDVKKAEQNLREIEREVEQDPSEVGMDKLYTAQNEL